MNAPVKTLLPPLLHARWIQLLLRRGYSNDALRERLDEDIIAPATKVLDAMRDDLGVQRASTPIPLEDTLTQDELQRLGLDVASSAMSDVALALLVRRNPTARELVDCAALVGVEPESLVGTLAIHLGVKFTPGAWEVYKALFFDITLVKRSQLRSVLEAPIRQTVRQDVPVKRRAELLDNLLSRSFRLHALQLRTDGVPRDVAWRSVKASFGWGLDPSERAAMLDNIESNATRRAEEDSRSGRPGDRRRAANWRRCLSNVRQLRKVLVPKRDSK
jgi:hypothetical protein